MKKKLRITYTDKLNCINELQCTGMMPQIKTKTVFIDIEIPDDEELFKFEEISIEND